MLISALFVIAGCSTSNVDNDDSLKTFFDEKGVHGSFALFNNRSGRFTIYNLARYRDSAYAPGATFEIPLSLIGFQTGVISADTARLSADSVTGQQTAVANFANAFKSGSLPYFQQVAQQVGPEKMQMWLDSLHYGNATMGGKPDSFWLNNTLKLTADEQLGFVKQLYFNQLPFYKTYQLVVKKHMLVEDKPAYKLYYKTGMVASGNKNLGQVAGWIEENGHPFLFVLNYETARGDNPAIPDGPALLKDILAHLGFLQGVK